MAQHRTAPTREHGRKRTCALDRDRVANEVDAAVDRVEPSGSEPMVYRAARQSNAEKLGPRDDAALAGGNLGDRPLTPRAANDNRGLVLCFGSRATFASHINVNPGFAPGGPSRPMFAG